MTLDELRRRVAAGGCPEPEIHSLEGMVYLVRVGDVTLTSSGRWRETLRFPSAWAAARALGSAGVDRGWLVHSSPYDEMIGRPDEDQPPPEPLRTPMSCPRGG